MKVLSSGKAGRKQKIKIPKKVKKIETKEIKLGKF